MNTDPALLEVLDVEVTPLPSPLRLAQPQFLASLKEVEAQIATLKITDGVSAQLAASLQSRLTKAGAMLEDTRKKLKAPFKRQGEIIDEAAKAPAARIALAKAQLQGALTTYDQEQQAKARKIEEDRQAELRRLEALRVAEEKERAAKAAELARLAAEAAKKNAVPTLEVEFDDEPPAPPPPKTEIEKQIEQVKHAPAAVVERPAGVSYRVSLRHTVTDMRLLPDVFVIRTAKDMAIRSTFCNGWIDGQPLPECPGVEFHVERTPVSTGKGMF